MKTGKLILLSERIKEGDNMTNLIFEKEKDMIGTDLPLVGDYESSKDYAIAMKMYRKKTDVADRKNVGYFTKNNQGYLDDTIDYSAIAETTYKDFQQLFESKEGEDIE